MKEYLELQEELRKEDPDITKVLFLTGIVRGLSLTGMRFPEIENAYIFIKEKLGVLLV
jgi:hypothetical protein